MQALTEQRSTVSQAAKQDTLQRRCSALQELYTPPIYAKNTHVHLITATGELMSSWAVQIWCSSAPYLDSKDHEQCLFPAVLRGLLHSPHYSRQVVQLADGGTIALDWYESSDSCQNAGHQPTTPIVLVLHPLTGMSPVIVTQARVAAGALPAHTWAFTLQWAEHATMREPLVPAPVSRQAAHLLTS